MCTHMQSGIRKRSQGTRTKMRKEDGNRADKSTTVEVKSCTGTRTNTVIYFTYTLPFLDNSVK